MYYVSKKLEVAGAHQLKLNYESKCSNLHGHNWWITVHCKSNELTENGMVIDFKHIKNMVSDKLDHRNLNEVFDFNPAAEKITIWFNDIVIKFRFKNRMEMLLFMKRMSK